MSNQEKWYYSVAGEQHGPVSVLAIRRLLNEKIIGPSDLVWKNGMEEWIAISDAQGIIITDERTNKKQKNENHAGANISNETDNEVKKKEFYSKKITAGICGIIFGGLGVHKFILGLSTPGAIMLASNVVGISGAFFCCIPIFLPLISVAVGFVEGIIYLSMSDEDFYEKYAVKKQEWF